MAVEKSKQMCNVAALCVIWYIISSSNNVIGKMVLSTFPYPMTVTMVQLTSIALYSGPFFNLYGIRRYTDIPWPYYMRLIVPLALGKFFSSVTSHISIWKVPVSYAHTGNAWVIVLEKSYRAVVVKKNSKHTHTDTHHTYENVGQEIPPKATDDHWPAWTQFYRVKRGKIHFINETS